MGLKGLWYILHPSSTFITLDDLNAKTLAIDVNIWIYQLLRASGAQSPYTKSNANLVLEMFFHRLCKLLYANICPVMVFEGSSPSIKKNTLESRALRLDQDLARSKLLLKKILKSSLQSLKPTTTILQSIEHEGQIGSPARPFNPNIQTESQGDQYLDYMLNVRPFSMEYHMLSPDIKLRILEYHRKYKPFVQFSENLSLSGREGFSQLQLERIEFRGRVVREIYYLKHELALRKMLSLKSEDEFDALYRQPSIVIPNPHSPEPIELSKELHPQNDNPIYMDFESICFDLVPGSASTKTPEDFVCKGFKVSTPTVDTKLSENPSCYPTYVSNMSTVVEVVDTNKSEQFSHSLLTSEASKIEINFSKSSAEKNALLAKKRPKNMMIEISVGETDSPNCEYLNNIGTCASSIIVDPGNLAQSFKGPTNYHDEMDTKRKKKGSSHNDLNTDCNMAQDALNMNLKVNFEKAIPISPDLLAEYGDLSRRTTKPSKNLITLLKDLSMLFGCTSINSYGEAEAQCAWLATNGFVDGVVSDDADIAIFCEFLKSSIEYETSIIRNLFQKKNASIECYNPSRIRNLLGINSTIYLSLIQFLKSDYGSGISGLGPVTALELAALLKDCNCHIDKLPEIVQYLQHGDQAMPIEWERFKSFLPKISVCESPSFPDQDIEKAYRSPKIHKIQLVGKPSANEMKIDVSGICNFMLERLNWPFQKTRNYLVPVLAHKRAMQQQKKHMTLRSFFPITKKPTFKSKRINAAINLLLKDKV